MEVLLNVPSSIGCNGMLCSLSVPEDAKYIDVQVKYYKVTFVWCEPHICRRPFHNICIFSPLCLRNKQV